MIDSGTSNTTPFLYPLPRAANLSRSTEFTDMPFRRCRYVHFLGNFFVCDLLQRTSRFSTVLERDVACLTLSTRAFDCESLKS